MNNLKEETSSKKVQHYNVLVDDKEFQFETPIVSGRDILIKAGNNPPDCFSLYQKLKGGDFEKISLHETVDLSKDGKEKFVVKPPEVFNYQVDEEPETTDESELSANQILALAGITPVTDYYLVEYDSHGHETSHKDHPDAPIKMKCPGSKFVSVFRGETPVS